MYGELIRSAREKKKITQKELAKRLGIDPVGIVQWEQNRRNPKIATRKKIAQALDIDITELMTQPEKKEYEDDYGTPADRVGYAVQDIGRIITGKNTQAQLCNEMVTSRQELAWMLEALDDVAKVYNVSKQEVKKALHLDDSFQGLDQDEIVRETAANKELASIVEGLNEAGREAVLRHARELAQIPDYQKKKR